MALSTVPLTGSANRSAAGASLGTIPAVLATPTDTRALLSTEKSVVGGGSSLTGPPRCCAWVRVLGLLFVRALSRQNVRRHCGPEGVRNAERV